MLQTIFIAIIVILILNLLLSVALEWLNLRSSRQEIPKILSDIYDPENYGKQQNYKKETTKLSIIESIIGTTLLLLFFYYKGFGIIQEQVSNLASNSILQTLLFFGAIGLLSLIISIPFSYYSNFVVEEKYGFNKSTLKIFVTDILKSIAISITLGGILVSLITWVFINYQSIFWLLTLGIILIFSLIMNALYSTIILPIFNKKKPLEDGELREKVVQFATNIGFSINNIYIIDGSKRSSKANAFFTGFGKKKSVFLYDTLQNKLTDDEIVAVIAHEIGHYKNHHIWINITTGLVQSAVFLYAFNYIANNPVFTQVMGFNSETSVFQLSALCFALLLEPIQMILGILSNKMSRSMEYQADRFASKHGMGNLLISSLKKLSSMNYSNLTPNAIYVAFHYSHPTLLDRVTAISRYLRSS